MKARTVGSQCLAKMALVASIAAAIASANECENFTYSVCGLCEPRGQCQVVGSVSFKCIGGWDPQFQTGTEPLHWGWYPEDFSPQWEDMYCVCETFKSWPNGACTGDPDFDESNFSMFCESAITWYTEVPVTCTGGS